jgi:hypothetical protein
MKKNIAMKWVKALRSGKYKQGQSRLRNDSVDTKTTTWCCLGVLCDIMNPDGWDSNTYGSSFSYACPIDGREDTVLPASVRKAAGMKSDNGERVGSRKSLVYLNDRCSDKTGKGTYSFDKIADIIEKEYAEL